MAEQKAVETKVRNKRRPFGVACSKLDIDKKQEGFHYRWVNDEPGRIQQAQDGDYTFVTPQEIGKDDQQETRVKILAGKNQDGSGLYAYLMKIPLEYFLEDQQEKQSYLDDIDAAIRGGKIEQKFNDNRYIPDGGISIKTK